MGKKKSRPLINEKRSNGSARSREQRVALAEMITRMFELWNLGWKDQLLILGLSEKSRTTLTRYRKGQPMARRKNLIARCTNLLSIHESLRLLFPQNRELVYSWPSIPNSNFGNRSPIDVMKTEGFDGILLVKRYLDCEQER
jgi:hypothetical protein